MYGMGRRDPVDDLLFFLSTVEEPQKEGVLLSYRLEMLQRSLRRRQAAHEEDRKRFANLRSFVIGLIVVTSIIPIGECGVFSFDTSLPKLTMYTNLSVYEIPILVVILVLLSVLGVFSLRQLARDRKNEVQYLVVKKFRELSVELERVRPRLQEKY